MPSPPFTLFIGRNVISLDRVSSTNEYAAGLVRSENIPEGTIVLAVEQTAGRGQRGRRWEAEPGLNLTFTLILSPSFLPVSRTFMLNKITSLAVRQLAADHTAGAATVKWPNDVLLDGKKVAGILIENIVGAGGLQWALVGVGINVNQRHFENLPLATSFSAVTGNTYQTGDLLQNFCRNFEGLYLRLRAGNAALDDDYLSNLFGYREWRSFIMDGKAFKARISGIEEDGKLCLENEQRERFCCGMQEVTYAFP